MANIYQTKVIVSLAGTDTGNASDSYNHTTHLCKNEDHYDLLIVNKVQLTTTTNFDGPHVVEDEISEHCNINDTEC